MSGGFNNINSNISNNDNNNQLNNVNSNNQFWNNSQNMNNNSMPSSDQIINIAESFLNVIKENTNDNIMFNTDDKDSSNFASSDAISDSFNVNNMTFFQNDINNVSQQVNENFVNNQNMGNVNDNFENINTNNMMSNVGNNQNIVMDNFGDNNAGNNQNNIHNNVNSLDDEELVKAFIGNKYENIKNSSFSVPTILFGIFYLFYRKMYLYGFLMLLLGPFAFIGIIIFAIKFKDIYMKFVNKKINKIKLNNFNKSYEEIKNICSKKGGTSLGMMFLCSFIVLLILIIFFMIIYFILVFYLSYWLLFENTKHDNSTVNNTENIIIDSNVPGTIMYDNSINTDEIFSLIVPEGFKKENTTGIKYSYSSDLNSSFSSCEFNIHAIAGHNSADEFVKYLKGYQYNDDNEVTQITINNINWYTYTANFMGINYNYVAEKDGVVYTFVYEEGNDLNDFEFCNSSFQSVLNSIKFK